MSIIDAVIAIPIVFVIIFLLINRPYYCIPFYYFGIFVRRIMLPSLQVRYQVGIQIALIGLCLLIVKISEMTGKNTVKRININSINRGFHIIYVVCAVELLNGILHGYKFFQIMVDVYKPVEILIYYRLFTCSLRDSWTMDKCLSLLTTEMICFAVIELFITKRGGIGLNMAMSLFPIFFARGLYAKEKNYWIVGIISAITGLLSQTRTYMVGYVAGLSMIMLLSRGRNKGDVVVKGTFILLISAMIMGIYYSTTHNEYLSSLFARIGALSQGFESTGQYRYSEIQKAFQKFKEAPIFGQGYGYLEYVYIELMGWFEWGDFMHNSYVEILAKSGLFGALLYGIGILRYYKFQYRQIKHNSDNEFVQGTLVGGIGGTISWMIVYFAAPLSSYGYVFIPGFFALIYAGLNERDKMK